MADPVDKLKQQEAVSVSRIAEISSRIREAVRAALPTPMEQFLTVMVPGKVINTGDYIEGFDDQGNPSTTILPTVTELNQAILCDDMPTLSAIQLGPTGRAVSRSYAATLSKLVPRGTTVGIEVADPSNLSDQERRYKKAMDWLTAEDPDMPGKTHVELYVEKQEKYTNVVEKKQKAFGAALQAAKDDPGNKTVSQQRASYDRWVNENARTYRNYLQAAYMDWVITGKKEAVEYWFSIVDVDSAMARVEQSKEAMRNATVMDTDGSAEYQKVRLEPSNWAWIAQEKAKGDGAPTARTVEWYTWEIGRLEKQNRVLQAVSTTPPLFKGKKDGAEVTVPETKDADAETTKATEDYFGARQAYQLLVKDPKSSDADKSEALKKLSDAREKMNKAMSQYDQKNIDRLNAQGQQAQDDLFVQLSNNTQAEIDANNKTIKEYDDLRKDLLKARMGNPLDEVSQDVGIPKPKADPQQTGGAESVTPSGRQKPKAPDYWTAISVEVAASYEHQEAQQSSQSTSSGASGGWGGFTAGGSFAYSKSSADAMSQMAKSSVKASFECMRVDISRSWLRADLFFDDDLRVSPGNYISPGPTRLAALMDPANNKETPVGSERDRQDELQRYAMFPMYPTAFLLASNVVLEISGETAAIQTHFSTSSMSTAASVGWGPFSMSVSHAQNESSTASTCETTASGCRITMKAPQIIGWISQIVPALPRLHPSTTTPPASSGGGTGSGTGGAAPSSTKGSGGQPTGGGDKTGGDKTGGDKSGNE